MWWRNSKLGDTAQQGAERLKNHRWGAVALSVRTSRILTSLSESGFSSKYTTGAPKGVVIGSLVFVPMVAHVGPSRTEGGVKLGTEGTGRPAAGPAVSLTVG